MKKLVLIAMAIIATCTWMSSCEKVEEYEKPTFNGMVIEPNTCYAGDTVKASLVYAVPGNCWYWYKSTFTVPSGFQVTSSYRGTCNDPAFVYFVVSDTVPEGKYTVSFSGQVTITSGENLWGDAYECNNTFTVKKK